MLQGVAPLDHLGVIRAEGEDAAKFLHGQLTHDFALLDLAHARLCAFLSAKGRMQASFIGFKRSPTEVWLVCQRDLLAATLKRLSMFVLRAKVRLSDASAELRIAGLAGDAINSIAGSAQPMWLKADFGSASVVHLPPAAGQPRASHPGVPPGRAARRRRPAAAHKTQSGCARSWCARRRPCAGSGGHLHCR